MYTPKQLVPGNQCHFSPNEAGHIWFVSRIHLRNFKYTSLKSQNVYTLYSHQLTIQIDVADAAFNHAGNSLSRVL